MKCIEFSAAYSRCKRGIPVARLFKHYYCEGDHKTCPLKRMEKTKKSRSLRGPKNLLIIEEGI